jgi:predicted membrane protein
MRRMIIGIIVIIIGAMMMAKALGYNEFDCILEADWKKYIIPGIVLLIGVKMVFGSIRGHEHTANMKLCEIPEVAEGEQLKISAAFSGNAYNLRDEDFHGARIDAFMGGISMDLRGAHIHDGSIMDIHTFMGGVELKLPQDIDLQVHSSCFIGGVNNPFPRTHSKDAKRLIIHANCTIGGVDIKC